MKKQQIPHPPSIIKCDYNGYAKQYKRGNFLGQGGFAHVYEVTSMDSGRSYACKVISKLKLKRKEHQRKLTSEIKLHQSISHPYIVAFERFFQDKKFVYILLENCSNRSLMELMHTRKKLSEIEVRYYMKQILTALIYLHRDKQVIHRDLKLGNLLLDCNMNIKICDFGLACKIEFADERKTTICGTPNYIAPEILDGKSMNGHSYEVDVWSFGVIMFTMLVGKPPFETKNIQSTYRRIKKLHYRFPSSSNDQTTSYLAKNLVSSILTISPQERPTLEVIEKHAFFTKMPIPKTMPIEALHRKPSMDELDLSGLLQMDHQQKKLNNNSSENTIANKANNHSLKKKSMSLSEEKDDCGGHHSGQLYDDHHHRINNNKNKNIHLKKSLSTEELTESKVCDDNGFESGPVYVVKYMDYTQKYGVGYILTNGSTGIYFNDATKITLHSNGKDVYYYDDDEVRTKCTMHKHSPELKKKISLIKHFQSYMWQSQSNNKNVDDVGGRRGSSGSNNNNNQENQDANNDSRVRLADQMEFADFLYDYNNKKYHTSEQDNDLYVSRWMRTKNAVLFRLNNRTTQVNFADGTKIIMVSVDRVVMYKNKQGIFKTYTMYQLKSNQNRELQKRMKYAQTVIKKFRK